ncbi:UBC-like protein [Dothidotthia symphoricarpi CBS 119687]|uniref:UBC-like protein n=1 Tax=Dothidotthia symphoricarpi CBS 119687 TaxID=1392245 RepID=A0A6A6AMI2_9PLEO|nr:UBC-like protein [Dothidotthia symphoricarpi CBS 119687]KAF2131691.1 UBC-like protein [Dothidotthia symphoricarpi CBS 119687]
MNSKSLRRLAADHGSLHTAGLPPNYLFPPTSSSDSLTALDVLLAGPLGTPYASGVWHLHLDIPPTYPAAPPTATFRTRLWHPNIEEATGVVCVETLKRDWKSELKLRDVLVTISCLLIQPNPASALNEAAGKLAGEDWDGYCRRARLMTSIHAGVPASLADGVREAQGRGEDKHDAGEIKKEDVGIKAEGKGKERVKVTPVVAAKAQRLPADDDAENTQQRGTAEPESDESDWIPGPTAARRNNNIFGIKGLALDSPPRRGLPPTTKPTRADEQETPDNTDPFTTITSKHKPISFDLRIPPPSPKPANQLQQQEQHPTTDTPELLKFSHQNPFSAIQPNNQTHPLLREFSYSWEETSILHDVGMGSAKHDLRKRVAGDEFEQKRSWEMKRFRKAGFDLGRYNRGDFGPRVGIGRL